MGVLSMANSGNCKKYYKKGEKTLSTTNEAIKVKRIGELVKEIREQNKLSIYRLAKLAALPYQTAQGIENGHINNPRFDTVVSLARALKVPIETFYIERRIVYEKGKNAV